MNEMYKIIEGLCKERGVSITRMCKEAGVARAPLTELKMERTQKLSVENSEKIAAYFGVSVSYLLGSSSVSGADAIAQHDFWTRYNNLPFNERFQIENLVDLSAQHPDKAPAVLEGAVYGFAETKKAPSEDGVMDSFTYAAHGYSGRLTDADKATIVKMMETLAAANEEDNGQADGGLSGSE